jgi:hypothetical protein
MCKLKTFAGVIAFAVLMLVSTSCGADRDLLTITIIPANTTLRQQGDVVQYIANGTYNRGPDEDITNRVTWASALESVATVNSSGLATAVVVPTCLVTNTTITASLDGKTAIADLRVTLEGSPAC